MERGFITSATHRHFKMEDFDSIPSTVLAELDYLVDMFDLQVLSKKGEPVVITLQEKAEHFERRVGLDRPLVGVRCWKCHRMNGVRSDLVQFDCDFCDSTNYALNGTWVDGSCA